MSTDNPKALIYCRVSSKGQETDGHGLESQETRCRHYAEAKGYDVLAVFPDTMSGGGSFMKRPGMVALLSFLDAQPDEDFVVIFDDLKRASRDTRAFLDLRDAFRKRGTRVECLNFKFDDSPEGAFIETIIAAQGALEREQNRRQVSQKMKARMQSGYWVHDAPVGYRYQAVTGRGKMLFPDAPLAAIIREAFEGYASGRFATQAEVTRFCAAFPDFPRNRKGEVVQQRIADFLSHPIYTGHICSDHYGIHWLKAQHEPLVSMETFERVQARRKGAAPTPKRAAIGEDFVLRGAVQCASCHTPLRSCWTKGNTRRYPYYLCQTKGCAAYGKSIPRDKIEGEVGEIIKALQPTENLMTLARAMFRHIWQARRAQAQQIMDRGKREIARLEAEITTIFDRIMCASNATIIQRYEDKIEDLERQKARLTETLSQNLEPRGTIEEKLEPAMRFLANPWNLWETESVQARRLVLKLAFSTPLEYCRNEGPRTPKIALPFKLLEQKSKERFCCGAGGARKTSVSGRCMLLHEPMIFS